MKKVLGLLSPLVLCFALQGEVIPPSAVGVLQVGDSVTNFDLFAIPGSKMSLLNVNIQGTNWAVSGNATVNPDPFIDYGFSIKNSSNADLAFVILLSTPYFGGPYTFAKSSHSGSVTDSSGVAPANGTVTVTAGPGGIHQPAVDGNPFGAIPGGCNVAGAPEDSFACGLGNVNGIAIATGATGLLSLQLAGTISAGDVYTFNGLASITNLPGDEVPEPATAGLAALALGGLVWARKRMAA